MLPVCLTRCLPACLSVCMFVCLILTVIIYKLCSCIVAYSPLLCHPHTPPPPALTTPPPPRPDPTSPPTHSYLHPLPERPEYGGRSYRVLQGNLSWYQALRVCLEDGSDLVSITDPFHQAFLTVLVNRLDASLWIGLYRQDVRSPAATPTISTVCVFLSV